MRIGYADPPYIGCAHLYKDHPDYAGEVDHAELIARLERDFDGWVLHAAATPKSMAVLAPLLALAAAIFVNLLVFLAMGKNPAAVFYALLLEPFLGWSPFSEVLLKTGPLLLIAQGLAIGFRAKVFNIGAEGQFILGAIFASAIPVYFPQATGQWIWPAMLLMGALGGALWAVVPAFWRVKLNANEILVTLMMSLIAAQVLNYLLLGPWKDPMGFNFPQSVMFQYDAMIPILLAGTRVNLSLLLALFSVLLAWVYMQRSFGGYQFLVGGLAPKAAAYAGFSESRAIWLSLLIGGILVTLMGTAFVQSAGERARKVQQLVRQRTSELRRSNRQLIDDMIARERAEKDADSIYNQACVQVDKMLSGAAAATARTSSGSWSSGKKMPLKNIMGVRNSVK